MTTKPLLLLVALTLCCCIASLHGRPSRRCICIRTSSNPVPIQVVKKVEVIAISGHCRRTEIIVTRRNNTKFCVDPKVEWLNEWFDILQKKKVTTTVSPTTPSNN